MNCDPTDIPVILLYNIDPAWPSTDLDEILSLVQRLKTDLAAAGHPVQVACLEDEDLERVMAGYDPSTQIVFNWCEEIPGIPRSSSLVAGALEELGFTFTGADSRALRFSQDKPAVKERLSQKNIATPRWRIYTGTRNLDWDWFPAIVKPAYEHCSYGITPEAVVYDRRELSKRITHVAQTFSEPALVEDFITGREFHVTVVGNGKLQVLPIAEMDFSAIRQSSGRLCTYDSKFDPASCDYQMIQLRLPASLADGEREMLEKTALAAYQATDCRDYARLDIRERDGIYYVLDVNPNSDISPDTSLALAAELDGLSWGQLGSLLVHLAALRHPILGRPFQEIPYQMASLRLSQST